MLNSSRNESLLGWRASWMVWAAIIGALPACGGGSTQTNTPIPIQTNDNKIHLQSLDYTLQPGDEKYYCYTMRLPADQETLVTQLTPTYGKGTHHILVAQTLAPEPEGFSECSVLFRTTWLPLYAGGVQSDPLTMPDGSGLRLKKGQQILLQLHLQNATPDPITDKTEVALTTTDPSQQLTQAGIFGMDNRVISIPPRSANYKATMPCTVSNELNVFAVLGHMHKHGKQLMITRGAGANQEMLYREDWRFEQQPTAPLKLHLNPGDSLHLQCLWDNPSNSPVPYGESSDTEMCATVLYYTPSHGLDGCVQTSPPPSP